MALKYAYGYEVSPQPIITVIPNEGEFSLFGTTSPPFVNYKIEAVNSTTSPVTSTATINFPSELTINSFDGSQGTFDGEEWIIGTVAPEDKVTLEIFTTLTTVLITVPTLTVELGNSLTFSISSTQNLNPDSGEILKFYLVAENAVGYTVASEPVEIVIQPTDAIEVTLPDSVRTSVTGFLFYHLAIGETFETASRVYRWQAYDDFGVERTFEAALLYRDEHLLSGDSVSLPSDLPTGVDRISGQTRLVIGGVTSSGYYLYDPLSTVTADGLGWINDSQGGIWERTPTAIVGNVVDITNVGGCAQDAEYVNPDLVRINTYLPGETSPVDQDTKTKYYFQSPDRILEKGTPLEIVSYVNGLAETPIPRTDWLAGSIKVKFLGYVNLDDGTLDTEDLSRPDNLMEDVGLEVLYHPLDTPLSLPKDLALNQAAVYEISLFISYAHLAGNGATASLYGTVISFAMRVAQLAGERAGWTLFTGNIVLKAGDMLRLLPDSTLTSGQAAVAKITHPLKAKRDVLGVMPNTVNNKLTVTGDGAYFIRLEGQVLPPLEAQRALFSLEEGHGAIKWSGVVVLPSGGGIEVVIDHPYNELTEKGYVKPTYPDVIAGMPTDFTPTFIKVFLENGTDFWSYDALTSVVLDTEQVLTVSTLTGATLTTVTQPSNSFGLFDAPTPAVTNSLGDLPAGAYRVGVAYYYTGAEITSISHKVIDGCIPESSLTWAEVTERVKILYGNKTLQEIKESTLAERIPYIEGKIIYENGGWDWVVWDPTDTSVPDDITVIIPDDLIVEVSEGVFTYPNPGRFRVISKTPALPYWLEPTTKEALEQTASTQFRDAETRWVILPNGKKKQFTWNATSTKSPGGKTIVPDNLMSGESRLGPGAWEAVGKDNIGLILALAAALGG